jgi:DNA-binding NtrC family response regulator
MNRRSKDLSRLRARVICVDDDPMVLAALRRALRHEPYEVRTTQDPAQALRWLEDETPSFLVTDLRMPGMSGEDLIREVRRRHPRTGQLLLTAYPEIASALLREGGDVMAKPWNDDGLRSRLIERLCPAPPAGSAGADSLVDGEPSSLIADVARALDRGRDASGDSSGRST